MNEEALRILDDPRFVMSADGCLEWHGSRTTAGYGRIGISGREMYVHRLVHEQEIGPIEGINVLHRCDNPPCGLPAHLFAGTQADNMADAIAKGRFDTSGLQRRGEWTHCPKGHEFTPENTYRYPKSGTRRCRICRVEYRRQYRERTGK